MLLFFTGVFSSLFSSSFFSFFVSTTNSMLSSIPRTASKASFNVSLNLSLRIVFLNSVDDFIKHTSDSEKYKNEIKEILTKDNELNNLPNKYQVAYKFIKNTESKIAENLNSQEFLDKYIISNENIKSQIINNYLSTINNISTAPKVISGNSTNIHFSPNTSKPKTLKEAGEIFSKMLN